MHCWKHTVSIAKLDALQPDAPRILLATGKLIGKGVDHPPLDTRSAPNTQRQRAFASLKSKGMARLNELIAEGVTASTISRLEREGAIVRLARTGDGKDVRRERRLRTA